MPFIKRNHEGVGYGKRLVAHAEAIAKNWRADKIYALSTQASGFFENLEWREGSLDNLPIDRAKQLKVSGSNLKIYFKILA